MIHIRRILYFWSGERAEEQGLRRAWSLARASGAELMVAGVLEKLPRDLLRMAPSQGLSRLAELAAAELRDRIRRAVDQLDGCPPTAQIKVLEGRMPQGLLEEAEAGGYDLLLLNAPRRGALRRLFSRDVPLMVIRACRVPVMVVRGGSWPRTGRILAAINAAASSCAGASLSRAVLEWAATLAWAVGAQLRVLQCWNLAGEELWTGRGGLHRRRYLQMLLRERSQARMALHTLMDQCNLSGLDVAVHVVKGAAGESIPELAASLQADLVVIGSPARASIRRFFSGTLRKTLYELSTVPSWRFELAAASARSAAGRREASRRKEAELCLAP